MGAGSVADLLTARGEYLQYEEDAVEAFLYVFDTVLYLQYAGLSMDHIVICIADGGFSSCHHLLHPSFI